MVFLRWATLAGATGYANMEYVTYIGVIENTSTSWGISANKSTEAGGGSWLIGDVAYPYSSQVDAQAALDVLMSEIGAVLG
jgi:hypothetical protein